MARCDLCNSKCNAEFLEQLLPSFQIKGVVDICPDCKKWADSVHSDLLNEFNKKMREAIAERAGSPASAGSPARTKWKEITERWFR